MHGALDIKSAQLGTADEKITLLQSQLSRRDNLCADQKRNLQTVKDEYEERLKALEAKYTAQKAIVLRLEESILDLYKTKSAVNLSMVLTDPDKLGALGRIVYPSDGLTISVSFSCRYDRFARPHITDVDVAGVERGAVLEPPVSD